MKKISIIVPCYNEEETIELYYKEMQKISKKTKNAEFELIFVNDGSTDKTLDILKNLAKNKDVRYLSFSRNFGKEAGIYAGLERAEGAFISIIDADLQQKPEYVLEMLDYLKQNPDTDIVTAYQEKRREGLIISLFKKIFYKLINHFSEVDFVDGASDFRTFKRCVADAILNLKEYYRFSKGIFSYVGFNSHYMPYKVEARHSGHTKWSFNGLFKYAVNGIVSFSPAPLKFATFIGSILSIFSVKILISLSCVIFLLTILTINLSSPFCFSNIISPPKVS